MSETEHPSSELSQIARERRIQNHNRVFERGQQLRARLAVLQEARDLRLQEGRALLAPYEAHMQAQPWDLRAADDCQAQRERLQGELAGLNGEIELVIRALNEPGPGRGTQWALSAGAEPAIPVPDQTRYISNDLSQWAK